MSISNGKTSSDIENAEWNSTGMLTHTRYGSSSSQASQSSGDICRICHCESDTHNPLLTPCYCSGSLKFVHQTCLQQWLTASETNACELCKFPFIMHTKIKPFNEWRSLEMSGVERRRLFCAVLFHCAAALCVIWSLCVLIERAAEEVRRGLIGWPFWTKLVVVTVGLTGGVVFMYIQCKQYLNLCNRWRARNRILLIQNAPEKIHPPQSPGVQRFPRVRTAATSGGGIGHNGSGGPGSSASYNSGNNNGGPQYRGYHQQQLIGSIGGGGHACELQINQQGQIIAANIENSSISYDRDWTLDDISQMSFKPCPQGSGSLTPMPFHDSAHNVCEGSGSGSGVVVATHRYSAISGSSNTVHEEDQLQNSSIHEVGNGSCGGGSIKTADLNLFKVPTSELSSVSSSSGMPSGVTSGRYPNSAIFLENRDILNDPPCQDQITGNQVKLFSRRSTVLGSGGSSFTQEDPRIDTRRYSDTKLLQQQKLTYVSECPVENSPTKDQLLLNPKSIIYDMTSFLGPVVAQDPEDSPHPAHRAHHHHHHHRHVLTTADSPSHRMQTTDIQFDNNCDEESAPPRASSYDPLEFNIQEMLELDIANIQRLHEKKSSLGNLSQHSQSSSSYCPDDPSSPCLGPSPTAKVRRPMICPSASNSQLQQFQQHHAAAAAAIQQHQRQMPQPLLQSQSAVEQHHHSNRLKLFKSLPNLSASSENLLPPPPKRFD
nr:uncharacterized protein LOC109422494 [Aedes albopictus]XP_029735969.1 uncharacterized protein LOC109422494 [Aedes albopictus]XP_029735970.1 uncharacterized protein LOC109422494 [Aedes albopictus]XP_029735971.1 uncharacterized protein LOC109422494 [Aedes albopictus]XP_029735972.1 uncharacterized protein LOC109422494 [Aedes albopictus]XP_029735973.1 uncharacterized protein LOC109422494 [Aedes albopictus]XP_029735974.1 uncharacterized protein LOC109422494 [Aedes albopictus]XP_029735975.1 unc